MHNSGGSLPPRVLVIGLDGATWTIARPLIERGRMPNLARLLARGTGGPLASTVPPISAAAWVTFLTGQNPGRHGVYQFRKLDLSRYGGYRDHFANSSDYQGRSFLEYASQQGRRVGAIGIPMTYPPFPVNGFLVSGFPRPFASQAQVYPPEMAARLGRWDEMPDNFNFSLSPERTVEASDFWVRKYTDIALAALQEQDYDLFLIVWNSTDTIPHLYWKYADPSFPAYDGGSGAASEPEASAFGDVINHQYQVADGEIGRLLAALEAAQGGGASELKQERETLVLVMSDHGMGPYPHRQVHLNAWLVEEGYLARQASGAGTGRQRSALSRAITAVRQGLPTEWRHRLRDFLPEELRAELFARHMNLDAVHWEGTRAYRLPVFPTVEGVVVNLRGRQPRGVVTPGVEYEALCDELVARLAALQDPETGEALVARAARREELFEGPHLDEIPDIILELNEAYTGAASISGPLVTPVPLERLAAYSATHRPEGLFVVRGPGIQAGAWLEGAGIVDLAPTLMHAMHLPVATSMDGRVLLELFEDADTRPVVYGDFQVQRSSAPGLSPEDEAAIREQLAGLGYLQ